MNLKNENGITMIALVITVILLTIIGTFALNIVNNTTDSSVDLKEKSELRMVQQAILERYTKYTLTKEASILVGDKITYNNILLSNTYLPYELDTLSPIIYKENMPAEECYYILYNDEDNENRQLLKKLGIENTSNVYIVNYFTGEVMQLETEEIEKSKTNAEADGKYVLEEISDSKCIVLKEEKYNDIDRYVIKQTSEGDLLYTYATSDLS